MVVANPIEEQYQMDYDIITDAINKAVKQADENGIKGKRYYSVFAGKSKRDNRRRQP